MSRPNVTILPDRVVSGFVTVYTQPDMRVELAPSHPGERVAGINLTPYDVEALLACFAQLGLTT